MPRSSTRPLALAAACLLAVPAAASAAPAPQAAVGPARADHPALTRMGLEVRDDGPAPRVVAVPKIRGVLAGDAPGRGTSTGYPLRQLPSGEVLLLGRSGWTFHGPDLAHLGSAEIRDDLEGRFALYGWRFTEDGGVVGSSGLYDGGIVGLGPGLENRWAIPLDPGSATPAPMGPVMALAAGNRLYVFGGAPAVLDARTGATLAPIDTLPDGETPTAAVPAPDGTARAVTAAAGTTGGRYLVRRVAVHRADTDGNLPWSTDVAVGQGALGVEASVPSVGPDGTTYIGVATSNGISRWDGRIVAVGPDGAVRWDVPVGGMPSRPAIDASGNVWTGTTLGEVVTLSPGGVVTHRRTLSDPKASVTVAAYGDGVLAQGAVMVRLTARTATAARPAASVALAPRITLQRPPLRCVAPAAGHPRTCLYRIGAAPPLRVTAPADGTADVAIAPVRTILVKNARGRLVPLRPARRTGRVLAGPNLLDLWGFTSLATVCRTGWGCVVRPGDYRVTVTLRTGAARRTFVRMIRVVAGSGVWLQR
ncbi:MAG: hypothetical protein IT200_09540 [Thermoleophilia bacterium]|nr:hypothetical protein [Thermoleophilia bacterium]